MARELNRLTAIQIKNAKKKGLYHDGGGLYLQVAASGAKSWLFCYRFNGRDREMGLGAESSVSLADARIKRQEAKKLLVLKIDPLEDKKQSQVQARLDALKGITFKECAEEYIDAHKAKWRNEKNIKQWRSVFEKYAYPIIGELPVKDIDRELILKIIKPIWETKTETADRIRNRIKCVLDFARVHEYRHGDNPAQWRGYLDHLLPAPAQIHKVKHFAALPFTKMGDFMITLGQQPGLDARALEFTILTAVRTNEAMGARWREIDFKNKIWTVPANRAKTGAEHRVPLTDRAIEVLNHAEQLTKYKRNGEDLNDWVFLAHKGTKPLSNMAMLMLLRRMERKDITVHGFRSTFRDWTAEMTNFSREVAEAALAHVIENKVEAAYRRGDLFEKRRRLMSEWADYCSKPSLSDEENNNVVNLREVS
jgi:integrase